MKTLSLFLILITMLSLISCGKKSDEYTDELPPEQSIDTVDHSSDNVKDPMFEQKN